MKEVFIMMKVIVTEEQIIQLKGVLSELRQGRMRFIQQKTEEITGQKWPDYVLQDWIYKNSKDFDPEYESEIGYMRTIERMLVRFIRVYGKGHWELKTLELDLKKFNPETQKILMSRKGGTENPNNVKNDFERFVTQVQLIDKTKQPSQEPIIVVQRPDGFGLIEGWHRTIMNLEIFKKYKQPAYIYIPN